MSSDESGENPETWAVAVRVFDGMTTTRSHWIAGHNSRHGICLFESQEHAQKYIYDAKIDGFPVKYTKEMQL